MSYIIIVGGQLHNKGAQAMTFTVIDELKERYPDKEVVLFASVYTDRDKEEEKDLNFRILPWPMRAKFKIIGLSTLSQIGFIDYIKYLIKGTGLSNKEYTKTQHILENADLMIDISGYALSSQRGFQASLNYLYNIKIAQTFNVPMVLYPQSLGPFDYNSRQSKIILPLIEEYLKYPEIIYAREKEGVENLKPFKLNNVVHSYDSVLQGKKELTLTHILKSQSIKNLLNFKVEENSVAIVPNEKVMEHGNQEKQYEIYNILIKKLLDNKKTVYLIRHSYEDLEICKNIKNDFINNKNVILLENDLNCIEIDNLLSQFEFLIASRYHAIIHAYKNEVPTIVFGWATKYHELLKYFSQEKYLFDVRSPQNNNEILENINMMLENSNREAALIKDRMEYIKSNKLLDTVKLN